MWPAGPAGTGSPGGKCTISSDGVPLWGRRNPYGLGYRARGIGCLWLLRSFRLGAGSHRDRSGNTGGDAHLSEAPRGRQ